MTPRDDAFEHWKTRAKAADILDVALTKLNAVLKPGARKPGAREHQGPCPRCCGKDRFSVNTAKQVFNCRGDAGGDVIAMVMHCAAVEFLAACEIINGEAPPARGTQLTAEAKAAAEQALADSAARAANRDADANYYRDRERRRARDMWDRAHPLAGSSAADYLALRGLEFPDTPAGRDRLKCIEDMPYWDAGGDRATVLHRGPAMVAPIVDRARPRKIRGLHLTYLDLAQPKGKLALADPAEPGAFLDAKKTRGSKRGYHVELIGPREPARLVLGEGIEKVLAVWRALKYYPDREPELAQTAFWSACDLGNLGGPAANTVRHPTLKTRAGRAVNVAGAVPDLKAPAIEVPDSVVELVLLGDSTSDRFTTQLAMCRAAARYARPGRRIVVAWAPGGHDFDDLWRGVRDEFGLAGVADIILDHLKHAAPPVPPDVPANDADTRHKGKKTRGRKAAPIGVDAPDAPGAAASAAGASSIENKEKSSHDGSAGARSANRARWGGPPNKYGKGRGALDKWLAFFPMTELGLIERYVQRERPRLRHCPALGWLAWDGKRWSREGAEAKAIAAGHDTVRAIQDEAASIRGSEFDEIVSYRIVTSGRGKEKTEEKTPVYLSDLLESFGRKSETKSAMTLHNHALAYLSHEVDRFDADHFAINILNGTLIVRRNWDGDLPRGWDKVSRYIRLKPHDPADLITKLAPVEYRSGAKCPLYDASMEEWQPEWSYRRFLDDWDGYSMTADASEQKLVLNIGTGKNGKTTWTSVKSRLLGDYGESVPITTLMDAGKARAAGQATPDLAMLRSIRMLLTSEPPKGWKVDEGLVKDLTGGDKISVRELHQKYFKLDPRFKLTIAGNHKPELSAGERESGIWRRIVLVDWKVIIPEEKRDLHLVDKLMKESSGILNRWLDGLDRWVERGLQIPNTIAAATEQYRVDRDLLGRFMSECTEHRPDLRASVTLTHELFVAWARAAGEVGRHDWTPIGFGKALGERGYIKIKANVMFWVGFRLTKKPEDFVGEDGRPIGGGATAPVAGDQAVREAPPRARAELPDEGDDPF